MRKSTVRTGIRFLITAVGLLLVGTFYNEEIGRLFSLTSWGVMEFVRLTLFWGGTLGGMGVVTVCIGLIRPSLVNDQIRLSRSVLFLFMSIALFFYLLYHSVTTDRVPRPLSPGETVII
jgi:hypothetical protein